MIPSPLFLHRLWHGSMVLSFALAFASGDEDTYALHLVAGYALLALLALRILLVPLGGIWRAPRLRPPSRRTWTIGAVALGALLALISGLAADGMPLFEEPHEALANLALIPIALHAGPILWKRRLKWLPRLTALLLMAVCAQPSIAQDTAEQRGESLFRTRFAQGDERTPSCTACHTNDPRKPGQNAKTGRPIDPMAPSVNGKRFTETDKMAKHFERDCKSVLGRACTAAEQSDFLRFMKGQ